MARPRKLRLSPFYDRQVELGGEFVVGAGWERPEWFAANAALVPGDAPWVRRDEWAARFWSPIEGAEHLATRSSAALFDLTAFAKFDVEGPDALAYLERICANRIDRPVGTIVYTAMLTRTGGIRCDLTITRKEDELFRVITGGGSGGTVAVLSHRDAERAVKVVAEKYAQQTRHQPIVISGSSPGSSVFGYLRLYIRC